MNFQAVLLTSADYKCLQLFCCLKLMYLASSWIFLLFSHFTWFHSLSCPSITHGCVRKKWNQACSHRRCLTAQTVQFKQLQFIWEWVHFPVPMTLLPFSDLPYLTDWLIDWLIDLCWGMGSALIHPWRLSQLWEQLHSRAVITGFWGHLLPAYLDLEKDICPLSMLQKELITDGCSVR